MTPELHVIDPDGDLLLLLSRPAEKKSEPESSDADENPVSDVPHTENESSVGRAASNAATQDRSSDTLLEETADAGELDIDVHMRVSSKHMMLASPVFKAMFQRGNFKEGRELGSTGRVEVPLDDNPEAFLIVLNVIHGRNRRVPRQVSMELMTNISILVDKYQMVEAVEVFSCSWIEDLKIDLPKSYQPHEREDVYRWVGISWVFGKRVEFKAMTQLIERGSNANLAESIEEGIPIPDILIKSIKTKREDALFESYDLIEDTLEKYQKADVLCPRTDDDELALSCDAILLGALLKSAVTKKIYPVPEAPYGKMSFNKLAKKIRSLHVEALCDKIDPWEDDIEHGPGHGLLSDIQHKIASLEDRLSGLDIDTFKEKKKVSKP